LYQVFELLSTPQKKKSEFLGLTLSNLFGKHPLDEALTPLPYVRVRTALFLERIPFPLFFAW
jgi:hypothetical protein